MGLMDSNTPGAHSLLQLLFDPFQYPIIYVSDFQLSQNLGQIIMLSCSSQLCLRNIFMLLVSAWFASTSIKPPEDALCGWSAHVEIYSNEVFDGNMTDVWLHL